MIQGCPARTLGHLSRWVPPRFLTKHLEDLLPTILSSCRASRSPRRTERSPSSRLPRGLVLNPWRRPLRSVTLRMFIQATGTNTEAEKALTNDTYHRSSCSPCTADLWITILFQNSRRSCLPAHSCVTMIRLCSQPVLLDQHQTKHIAFQSLTAEAFGSTLTTKVHFTVLFYYSTVKTLLLARYLLFGVVRSRSAEASLEQSLSIEYASHYRIQRRYHYFHL